MTSSRLCKHSSSSSRVVRGCIVCNTHCVCGFAGFPAPQALDMHDWRAIYVWLVSHCHGKQSFSLARWCPQGTSSLQCSIIPTASLLHSGWQLCCTCIQVSAACLAHIMCIAEQHRRDRCRCAPERRYGVLRVKYGPCTPFTRLCAETAQAAAFMLIITLHCCPG